MSQTHNRIRKNIDRAKDVLRRAVDLTIHFEEDFAAFLKRRSELFEADWYKRLPQWAKSEIKGYDDCYRTKLETVQEGAVFSCLLVDGLLYRSFEHWREHNPDADAATLQHACCSVYPSGKIFSMYEDSAYSINQGQQFPFAD